MKNLRKRILDSNIQEHMKEAKYYDTIHTELYNQYEQNRIITSLTNVTESFNKDCKILDIGCGTGNIATKLLDMGFKNIICLDISKEMMAELKEKVKSYNQNIKFIVSDVDSFLENNNSKFDIVTMSSVLHHLPDYVATLKDIKKVLNEYGCIFITHEPLSPKKPSILITILLKLDFLIYIIRYIILIALGKLKYLKRDCQYSDYHTGYKAIQIPILKKIFGHKYKLKIKKYPIAKSGLAIILLNKMKYFNSFEMVVVINEEAI